jgi:hypothetical protein
MVKLYASAKLMETGMLNFSQKATKRFRMQWSGLEERSGDFWKVDVAMFAHVPLLMIVHEYTLFTLIRPKSQFKTPQDIAAEIRRCCTWYRCDGQPTFGRNGNKRIIGSITQMKRETWQMFLPEQINAIEIYLNNNLYSYIAVGKRNYGKPFEAVEGYVSGCMPWLEKGNQAK